MMIVIMTVKRIINDDGCDKRYNDINNSNNGKDNNQSNK